MKKTIFLLLLVILSFAINSCDDELAGTKHLNYVTFEAPSVNLGVDIGGTNVYDIKVFATQVTGSDRTFNVKVVSEKTTADPELFSVPTTVTIPANSNEGILKVTLTDGNDSFIALKETLVLDIEPQEGLFKGQVVTVNISQICPANAVSLNLIFDGYASECTWDLFDDSGNEIASGGPYVDGQANASVEFCLDDGTYTFTIYDLYGDGLSYPTKGSATLLKGTVELGKITGDFGESKSVVFTVNK